jgi:hypothetical protein
MVDRLPIAPPFAWHEHDDDDNDDYDGNHQNRSSTSNTAKIKRPSSSSLMIGSGFCYLHHGISSNFFSNDGTKQILSGLLQEHGIPTQMGTNNSIHRSYPDIRPLKRPRNRPSIILGDDMNEDALLSLSSFSKKQEKNVSLLGSLLSILDRDDTGAPISAKILVAKCALTVNPASAPGNLDAREVVLAALQFLSQEYNPHDGSSVDDMDSIELPNLPLIRPVAILGDLERRNYEKVGDWTLTDILPSIFVLEDHFYHCYSDYRFLPREKFLPITNDINEDEKRRLLWKGEVPNRIVKTEKRTYNKKQKTSTPTPSEHGYGTTDHSSRPQSQQSNPWEEAQSREEWDDQNDEYD